MKEKVGLMKKERKISSFQILCAVGLAVSIIGVLASLGIFMVEDTAMFSGISFAEILAIPFIAFIYFVFLLIGAPLMGYESLGTPLNVTVNLCFYGFLILWAMFLFLSIIAHIGRKNRKTIVMK